MVPKPVLSASVLPPRFHALRALLPLSEFLPPLALTDLDDAISAAVLDPATSASAAAVGSSVSADAYAVALVHPVFGAFKCLDVVAPRNTILQIYR